MDTKKYKLIVRAVELNSLTLAGQELGLTNPEQAEPLQNSKKNGVFPF